MKTEEKVGNDRFGDETGKKNTKKKKKAEVKKKNGKNLHSSLFMLFNSEQLL